MAPPTMAPPISPAATPAATPRCALAGVATSEPAIVATATKPANVFFILGPPVLAWRAATRPPHHPKTPRNSRRCTSIPRRAIVSDQLSALIGAGFELLICKVLTSVVGPKTEIGLRNP